MGFFDRVSRLFKSNANAAIDKLSDPAKEIEQIILEMEEQLRAARGETVKVRADEKRCARRVGELEKRVAEWGERAEAAVRLGDDDMARKALEQRMNVEQELAEARRELAETAGYGQQLTAKLVELEHKLKTYKLRKGTIKAKATMGKRDLGPGTTDAFDEFDRMAGRVDENEDTVGAAAEVEAALGRKDEDAALARRIEAAARARPQAQLPGTSVLDERLAALKDKMAKKDEP